MLERIIDQSKLIRKYCDDSYDAQSVMKDYIVLRFLYYFYVFCII
jgi:hypothetical protein